MAHGDIRFFVFWCYIHDINLHDHDDIIKWKYFPRYWPFVRGIHRSPVNSPHRGQWRGSLMFPLIFAWINVWVNNHEIGDLRRHGVHYDVTVMFLYSVAFTTSIYTTPLLKWMANRMFICMLMVLQFHFYRRALTWYYYHELCFVFTYCDYMFMNCISLYGRTYADVITWIPFPWPFVRGILHSPMASPHKGMVMRNCDDFYIVTASKLLSKH